MRGVQAAGLLLLFLCSVVLVTMAAVLTQQELVSLIQETLQFHKDGRVHEAIAGYERVLPLLGASTTKASLLGNAGALLSSQGEFERARAMLAQAVEIAPDNAQSQFNLAVVLTSKLGQHAKALKHCALAIRQDRDHYKAYHLMGNILQSLGKNEEAERYFALSESVAASLSAADSEISTVHSSPKPLGIKKLLSSIEEKFKSPSQQVVVGSGHFTVRVLSRRPLALLVEDFVTKVDCDHIKDRASASLERSFVMGNNVKNLEESADEVEDITNSSGEDSRLYRSSFNAWLSRDSMLDTLQERLSLLLDIPLGYFKHKSEDLQVVRYGLGGQFKAHQDSSSFHSRLLTALVYLDDLPLQQAEQEYYGGGTWFPFAGESEHNLQTDSVESAVLTAMNSYEDSKQQLDRLPGMQVAPTVGNVLIFFNYDAQGAIDPLAVHAGLPVLRRTASSTQSESSPLPSKWIANYWLDYDEDLLSSYYH